MNSKSNFGPSLANMGPQWFAPVLGWSGLALAWHRGADRLGSAAALVSSACLAIAASIFLLVLLVNLVRIARFRAAFRADFSHPIRHGFVAAFPISLILLATNGLLHGGPRHWLELIWICGVTLLFATTVWVISRWIGGRVAWATITPILYIPIVGNILVPLAGVPLGYHATSWFFFGIGAFFWPVLTALMLARLAHQPLPDALLPSWFITIAPPAVGGLAAISLGMSDTLLPAALGLAALSAAACAIRVPSLLKGPFGMPAWASSFPMAALSALTLRATPVIGALDTLSIALLAITTMLILGLTLATLKGLRTGILLAPEPVAVPVAVKAA